ncbi:hypothetical protein [Streptomyces sp. NPDC047061]|uniref:hypothetical protein n=1 Tax=Streptomyces sp. NPDC047061 TaxID=3154605 RepID=UPI0033F6F92D
MRTHLRALAAGLAFACGVLAVSVGVVRQEATAPGYDDLERSHGAPTTEYDRTASTGLWMTVFDASHQERPAGLPHHRGPRSPALAESVVQSWAVSR